MSEETVSKSPSMKLLKPKKAVEKEVKAEVVEDQEVGDAAPQVEAVDTTEAQSLATPLESGDVDVISQIQTHIDEMAEEEVLKAVPLLVDTIEKNYFQLGGALSLIQSNSWHTNHGFENLRQYVESECGMEYRKAMYLISIYNSLTSSGVEWTKVKDLGWSKLKEIANIITTENVDEWVEVIKDMQVFQIREYIKIKTAGTTAGDNGESAANEAKKLSTMTFKVHEDQKQSIREALDKNKHESGTEFDTVALENICIDYLAGDSKLKKNPTLVELMQGMDVNDVVAAVDKVFPDVNFQFAPE